MHVTNWYSIFASPAIAVEIRGARLADLEPS
jgi:hypothetical protein